MGFNEAGNTDGIRGFEDATIQSGANGRLRGSDFANGL